MLVNVVSLHPIGRCARRRIRIPIVVVDPVSRLAAADRVNVITVDNR
jgi:hypothetical protein